VTTTLKDVVRSATREAHQQLEQRLDVERGAWTRSRYESFLRGTLAVVAPTEPLIAQHLRPYFEIGDGLSAATSRLRHDLSALGGDPESAAAVRPACLPDISNAAQAFGAAYVLEGSRLGGQVIAEILTKRLAIDDRHLTYLRPPEISIGARWRAFVTSLDAFGRATDLPAWSAVADTATRMFASFAEPFAELGVLDAG